MNDKEYSINLFKILKASTDLIAYLRHLLHESKDERTVEIIITTLDLLSIYYENEIKNILYIDFVTQIQSSIGKNYNDLFLTGDDLNESFDNYENLNNYKEIIAKTFKKIIELCKKKEFEEAYDLIDVIHVLPEAISKQENWNEKNYWKNYFYQYRKKWNTDFLCDEEKKAKNKRLLRRK